MNYELQVNALCLSLFYRRCSLSLSRGYFCRVLQAKSEFNAEVAGDCKLNAKCLQTDNRIQHTFPGIYPAHEIGGSNYILLSV